MGSTRIRPARPEDAPFLARMALLSSRGHLDHGFHDVRMPGSEEELLRRLAALAVTRARSYLHYTHRLVLEAEDGCPAASLSALTNDKSFGLNLAAARREVLNEAEFDDLVQRTRPLATCFIDAPPGSWGIEVVACEPAYRRRGYVGLLLEVALATGRALGHALAALSVEIDNYPALLAYEKYGFRIAEERRHPDFEAVMGSPGIWLMTREL